MSSSQLCVHQLGRLVFILYNYLKYTKYCFTCHLVVVQIMSETLPDLADLLPPSSSDVSLGLSASTIDDELMKLLPTDGTDLYRTC